MNAVTGFFNNLFGTIAAGSFGSFPIDADFAPTNGSGDILKLRGADAVWIGLRNPLEQLKAYEFCYPVSSVIDRMAESDITGTLEINKIAGKDKDNSAKNEWSKRMRKLLLQPNPLQTWEQFRGQQIVYKKVFGYCPVLPITPTGFGNEYATALINLPPWLFEAVSTNQYLNATSIEGMVKYYRVTIQGKTFTLQPDQVMILEDAFLQDFNRNFLLPQSKLVGLDMAVSNICAAMEADNVLLKKKGPLGFISMDAGQDGMRSQIIANPAQKEELQKDLAKYGLSWSQYQFVISKLPSKWNPMGFDVKQLGTKETVLAGSRAICQRYGFPYVLFEDSDATFSNQESAHKKFYDNNVIPNNRRDMAKYNAFFGAYENDCCIEMDYSHLAIFQEDALNEGRALAYLNQGLQIAYQNDIITLNQWLQELQLDTIDGGDKYYSQSNLKISQDQAAQAQADAQQSTQNLDNQTKLDEAMNVIKNLKKQLNGQAIHN